MVQKLLIIVISWFFIVADADAATLTNIQGSVLVNKGNGFRIVEVLIGVEPGDRVLVRDGGSADIVYETGCILPIGAHQMLVVPRDGGCHSVVTLPGSLKDSRAVVNSSEPNADRSEIVVGGFVVAGGGAAVLGGGNGHSKPVSP